MTDSEYQGRAAVARRQLDRRAAAKSIQNRLDLLIADQESGASRLLLREQDRYWINVHDHLRFSKMGSTFCGRGNGMASVTFIFIRWTARWSAV
jgi:hypothetical protein